MLDSPKRLSEVRDVLMREFEVDAETCERDLKELLRDLERDGLVSIDAAAP